MVKALHRIALPSTYWLYGEVTGEGSALMPAVPEFVLHRMARQTQSRSDVSLEVPLDVETQS